MRFFRRTEKSAAEIEAEMWQVKNQMGLNIVEGLVGAGSHNETFAKERIKKGDALQKEYETLLDQQKKGKTK
jgi:hypothetical protein